eukprot:PITA_21205
MVWSPANAINAYLQTVKLCKLDVEKKRTCLKESTELESTELISALAAGMNAQLIVEVSLAPSATTIALATAARQTGGRLVCILPVKADTLQAESVEAMKEFGLEDTTDFVVGDARELLPSYKSVDFCLIDCKGQDCSALFKLLRINPSVAVVVANNLLDSSTTAAHDKTFKRMPGAKYITLPIGKGIEMTRIGSYNPSLKTQQTVGIIADNKCTPHDNINPHAFQGNKNQKSRWIVHVDERTGEEHVFRVRKHRHQLNNL